METLMPQLRVKGVSVRGLFGLYDHDIQLKHQDRVTILHGPNGVGKSVVLRLISSFFDGRYQEFAITPFLQFSLSLNDGTSVTVTSNDSVDSSMRSSINVCVSFPDGDTSFQLPIVRDYEKLASQIERISSFLTRFGDNGWYDHRSAERINSRDVVLRYGSPTDQYGSVVSTDSEPQKVKILRQSVSVQLIETQRLLRPGGETKSRSTAESNYLIATVKGYSEDLVRRISRTLTRYGSEAQKLDQTFPERLLAKTISNVPTADELKSRLTLLDQQLTAFNRLGLIDKVSYPVSPTQLDALDEAKRSVMSLVLDDIERKMQNLQDLAKRIRLLLDSINGKFRNKTISVTRDQGLVASDLKGRALALESLSSGEQHELILWFDLLFKVSANTLVLIDEPELSLHVTWQKKFLPELLEIAQTVQFDALLATHSPFIIGDRLDLTVALDAGADV